MNLPVIRNRENGKTHNPNVPALVEVSGAWVRGLYALTKLSEAHSDGVMVTNIGPGSIAAEAGMMRGDILLSYDGTPVHNTPTLKALTQPGSLVSWDRVVIEVVRGDDDLRFEVPRGRLGITVSALLSADRLRRDAHGAGPAPNSQTALPAAGADKPVIRSLDDARAHPEYEPGIIEVSGRLVRAVVRLLNRLEGSASYRQKKRIKSLLRTAAVLD
jgi:hypothetical protein